MSFLTYDPTEAGGAFDVLPAGEYEVIITKVEQKTFSSGNEGLNVELTVRDDVDQEGKKRKIFDTLVATPKAMFKFHQYAKALGKEKGWEVPTLAAFAKELVYKPVRANVDIEEYTKNDGSEAKRNRVKFVTLPQFKHSGLQTTDDPFANDGTPVSISNDDLPF